MLAAILSVVVAHAPEILSGLGIAILDKLVELLHPSPSVNNLIGLLKSLVIESAPVVPPAA